MTWFSICMYITMFCGVFNACFDFGQAKGEGGWPKVRERIFDIVNNLIIAAFAFFLLIADEDLTNTWGRRGLSRGLETNTSIVVRDTTAARKVERLGNTLYILTEDDVEDLLHGKKR